MLVARKYHNRDTEDMMWPSHHHYVSEPQRKLCWPNHKWSKADHLPYVARESSTSPPLLSFHECHPIEDWKVKIPIELRFVRRD